MKIGIASLVILAVLLLGGCRLKSVESYNSAMQKNDLASGKTIDPYTYGGTAGATGGHNTQTSYATSKPGSGYAATPVAAPVPAKK